MRTALASGLVLSVVGLIWVTLVCVAQGVYFRLGLWDAVERLPSMMTILALPSLVGFLLIGVSIATLDAWLGLKMRGMSRRIFIHQFSAIFVSQLLFIPVTLRTGWQIHDLPLYFEPYTWPWTAYYLRRHLYTMPLYCIGVVPPVLVYDLALSSLGRRIREDKEDERVISRE